MTATLASTAARGARAADAGDDAFLAALGRRVRELRTDADLTRRQLAQEAGVSERYLAQLESGAGNSSILLLRNVAGVLGVGLDALFTDADITREARLLRRCLDALPAYRRDELLAQLEREQEQEAPVRRRRIALIGLRGAGKSTLGAALAARLSWPFVELDREVERDAGMTLAEIFSLYGQAGYRRLERRALERVLRRPGRMVLAAGGGIVADEDSYRLLLRSCRTVWLQATPEEHMRRVIAQGDLRPMAGRDAALSDLRAILREREPLYRRADLHMNTSGQKVAACVERLCRLPGD